MAIVRQSFYWEIKANIDEINREFVYEAHEVLIHLLEGFVERRKKHRAHSLFSFNYQKKAINDEMKDALEVLNLIHHSADPVRSLIGRLNLLCKLDKFEVKSDLNMLFSAFFSVYTQYLPFFRDNLYQSMAVDHGAWQRLSLTAPEYKVLYCGEYSFNRGYIFAVSRFRRYHQDTRNELFDCMLQSLIKFKDIQFYGGLDEILWVARLKNYLPPDKKPLFLSALMPLFEKIDNIQYIKFFKSWIVNDGAAISQISKFQVNLITLVKDRLLKGNASSQLFKSQCEALRELTKLNHAGINENYYNHLVSMTEEKVVSKFSLATQAMLFMDLSRFVDKLSEEKKYAIVVYLLPHLEQDIVNLAPPIAAFIEKMHSPRCDKWNAEINLILDASFKEYKSHEDPASIGINLLVVLHHYYKKRERCFLLKVTISKFHRDAFDELFKQSLSLVEDQSIYIKVRKAEWRCFVEYSHFFSFEQKKEWVQVGCSLFHDAPDFSDGHLKALVPLADYLTEKDKAELTEKFLTAIKQDQDYVSMKQKLNCLSSCQSVLLLHGMTWDIVGEAFIGFVPTAMLDEAINYLDKWSPSVRKRLMQIILDESNDTLLRLKEEQWEKIRFCVTPAERIVMMRRLADFVHYIRPAYTANYFAARFLYDDFFHDHQREQEKHMMHCLLEQHKEFLPFEDNTFSDIKQRIMRLM